MHLSQFDGPALWRKDSFRSVYIAQVLFKQVNKPEATTFELHHTTFTENRHPGKLYI